MRTTREDDSATFTFFLSGCFAVSLQGWVVLKMSTRLVLIQSWNGFISSEHDLLCDISFGLKYTEFE